MTQISDVQAGCIGEYLCSIYAMPTTGGALVPFSVAADDDHRDLVVAVKGKSALASLQAKACFRLGASGFVQSNATYSPDSIPNHPSWIYVVVLVLDLAPVVVVLTGLGPSRRGRLRPARPAHPETRDIRRPDRARPARR